METTFPSGGVFWPRQYEAFQRSYFAVFVNFTKQEERGKKNNKKKNKQPKNFLCENEF